MATLTRGYSFGATEQVTNAKLHGLVDDGAVSNIATADFQDASVTNDKIASCSGAKLITLSSTPSGAGVFPVANTNACLLTTNQTVAGIKTFSSFPLTPSTDPTEDYQVTNKKYVIANPASGARGDILYHNGTAYARLAKGTENQYLQQGANDPAWATLPNQFGVAFSWSGSLLAKFNVGAITNNVSGTNYAYVCTTSQSYNTVYTTKYRKVSGVNTIKVYAAITGNTGGNHCKVIIGTATAIELSSGGWDNVFTWDNDDIDVSGLTDGTVYDVTVQLKGYESRTAKMAELIGFAS